MSSEIGVHDQSVAKRLNKQGSKHHIKATAKVSSYSRCNNSTYFLDTNWYFVICFDATSWHLNMFRKEHFGMNS